ncbi:hypothetical protein OESDEN_18650 [Oesophagostomum dentatum]|uniref:Uncharacterized protein n=1 Tax=Oesophagostomum dentatum TaxID=61180 RepID=A0A0B1SDT6_OESDE|nr:hypothetical protein OESDEN_18650 [Oesophagostomum dentatum]
MGGGFLCSMVWSMSTASTRTAKSGSSFTLL